MPEHALDAPSVPVCGDGAAPVPDVEGLSDQEQGEELVARVAAERRAGRDDSEGVEELLRRAAHRNRAALDRLAQ